ncbi:protein tweety homolog 1-B-like isoform X2 [Ruditapes philippinarum]|uniref:protein tweety homolog 1-B-like isoform X2 n=1 Tax=Ruditapes philippinarum TaxID=129788 RepID=UPI00295B1700|nr:protein tweety homolog 1-B-like isoform X2 [Ruditapes philippinarum]
MSNNKDYHVDWVAYFLHQFPHINFQFEQANSTFDPVSEDYRNGVIFLAALPIVCLVVFLLLISCCLCINCCCRQRPTKKKSTTCVRFITALFIIFAIGSVAVGYFGNEEGNKGVQSTVDALQDANDTLSGSLATLTTLDSLTSSITLAGVEALKHVFSKHLKNITLRDDVLKLADEITSKSNHVKGDIDYIKTDVGKISLDKLIDYTQNSEFYRWIGTIVLLSWQVLVLLVYIIATLKKSKYWIVWGIIFGMFSLFLVWAAFGVYLGGTVAVSDFCVDPNAFVLRTLEPKVSPDVIESYIECKNNNFSKALDDARDYVTKANETLNLAINKTLPYNISKYLEGPVQIIRGDLGYAQGNISSLGNSVYCGQIHSNYIKALKGLCNRSLVGMSLILLILPILGLSFVFIQCLAPKIWLLLGTRKEYRVVDDSDPFLPRPPPYNSYGTMVDERAPLSEASYLDDSTVMTSHPRTESVGSDSPPPAFQKDEYYPGSFVEQYNNLGTFPRRQRQQN